VEKVVICTFTLEHHEFQRRKGKTYFLAVSAILFVWVTNGVILPLDTILPQEYSVLYTCCAHHHYHQCNHHHHHYHMILLMFYIINLINLQQHASRFTHIFMNILKMYLNAQYCEITKRKQFEHYQWHLKPM
jgi:hypothetical protein